jgi:hypothetical protein
MASMTTSVIEIGDWKFWIISLIDLILVIVIFALESKVKSK